MAATVWLFLLASCGRPPSVEQQIIATIRQMEEEVEAGESHDFLQHIDAGFSGPNEAMTRDQVRALLLIQLNQYQRLRAQLFPIHVSPAGADAADARFRALVTGGPGWIPESGQVYAFQTHWRRDGGDWLLVAADWEPVPLEEALQDVVPAN